MLSWIWPVIFTLHFATPWRVTQGHLASTTPEWRIDVPSFRAERTLVTPDHIELAFQVSGLTKNVRALRSGAMRAQIGLKLRAQDSCNALFVMWSTESTSSPLRVLVKRNPAASEHGTCGNSGYRALMASHAQVVAPLSVGPSHTMAAAIVGKELTVRLNEVVVWRGPLPADALSLRGPVGVRSDNLAWSGSVREEP